MLGSMVLRRLAGDRTLGDRHGPRRSCRRRRGRPRAAARRRLGGHAIGVIKPYIRDDDAAAVERALRVNGLFPHILARAAERSGCRVLQIATDCVYAGTIGNYREAAPHDALDVYGKTKSLGEVNSAAVHHLRCSIIGPNCSAASATRWRGPSAKEARSARSPCASPSMKSARRCGLAGLPEI